MNTNKKSIKDLKVANFNIKVSLEEREYLYYLQKKLNFKRGDQTKIGFKLIIEGLEKMCSDKDIELDNSYQREFNFLPMISDTKKISKLKKKI